MNYSCIPVFPDSLLFALWSQLLWCIPELLIIS